ncbi:MAG: ABC transporter ATP-binding protein [Nitrospirae bacterium]|nr:MAG: ABC transporter ATP-binding protein [Nitrospirota bacterium]
MSPSSEPAPHQTDSSAEIQDIVLTFHDVSKSFVSGHRVIHALTRVSFTVRRGTVTGIIGPDGAGKTTLMRLAATLLRPDQGHISVLGMDTQREAAAIYGQIGYMPQRFGLYEDLTVQENLDLYADLHGLDHDHRSARYRQLMVMTGLEPFTRRLAGQLSGGMKQKLGLACSLLGTPPLLLLDEPTVGVDPLSRRELWTIVDRLVREEGTSVVLTTSYIEEAERCPDVLILHEGTILGRAHPSTFKREIEGRVYQIHSSAVHKRLIHATLTDRPEVVDAMVQGESVRLVLRDPHPETLAAIVPAIPQLSIAPVPPRLEDWFIVKLRQQASQPAVRSQLKPLTASQTSLSPAPRAPVIQVRHAQRRFGDFYAVHDVSFDVLSGEIFGLLGPNGAGKSTTFRMLCGLLPPSGGHLTVAGVDLRRARSAARQRIGYMSQKFSLYRDLSVRENLRFFSSAYGLRGDRRRERNNWALDQFGLRPFADAVSGELPLGYKQRLALACALMHEPDILFLDEPTSGVDPLARREFWHRILELAGRGVTIMVTTHVLEEAEYCDRIAIMAHGRLLTLGTPDEIKRRARTVECPTPSLEDAFVYLIHTERRQAVVS